MSKGKIYTEFRWGHVKERNQLAGLEVDGKQCLNRFKEVNGKLVD
jgi:hypothetical protein